MSSGYNETRILPGSSSASPIRTVSNSVGVKTPPCETPWVTGCPFASPSCVKTKIVRSVKQLQSQREARPHSPEVASAVTMASCYTLSKVPLIAKSKFVARNTAVGWPSWKYRDHFPVFPITCRAEFESLNTAYSCGGWEIIHRTAFRIAANSDAGDGVLWLKLSCNVTLNAGITTPNTLTRSTIESPVNICMADWCQSRNRVKFISFAECPKVMPF